MVNYTAPWVESTALVVDCTAPAVNSTAPVVNYTAPVLGSAAIGRAYLGPMVHSTSRMVTKTATNAKNK